MERMNTSTMKKWTDPDFRIGDLVLYKNNQFIAFNKPAGLAVQNDLTGDRTLLQLAENYTQHPLHLIHRLDRPATGVVLLAKNAAALAAVNQQFQNRTVEKIYLAAVGQLPPESEGMLIHYLRKQSRGNRAQVLDGPAKGAKEARLHYRVVKSIERYHLLEIKLITGRHHQVRAQLAAIGCPIRGDVKYGFRRSNRDRSINLHAWKLSFNHPVSGERVTIEAPLPEDAVWDAFRTEEDQ